jgi:hypothetical protein
MAEDKGAVVQIPIEHVCPATVETRFADRIVVQHTEHEFHISFYEIERPVLLGAARERNEGLRSLESVRAVCVAHVVVAAGRMPDMVQALRDNLDHYLARVEQPEE